MGLFKGRSKKQEEVVGRIEVLGEQIRRQRQELAENSDRSLAEFANLTGAKQLTAWDQDGPPAG